MFNFLKKNQSQNNPPSSEEPKESSWLQRLSQGLSKTRRQFASGLTQLFSGSAKLDEETLETLETHLLAADVGVEATAKIIETLKESAKQKKITTGEDLQAELQAIMVSILSVRQQSLTIADSDKPFVLLMIGMNGAGKTTTIGKLAKRFKDEGKTVMLAAGDTFRAAAVEQLSAWGQRNDIPVIAQQQGADSASVIFDALQSAKARKIDVLIADTAGRLHTQQGLMAELAKIKRVIQKVDPEAPHETLLVLDASIGQNALQQAKQFHEAMGVTGIVMTKLDGTAKGGMLLSIAQTLDIPIRFIGVGEQIDDMQIFNAAAVVNAIFTEQTLDESTA
ncbi:MAG: signal recognition particle-docking protein FtsY [Gammaproteobacteria bacterium]|nr:signal recognition particle-docking protein FtsY [Gammaproteobacteria bacterium]